MSSQSIISFTTSLGQGILSLAQKLWRLVPSWSWNSSHPRLAEIMKKEELKITEDDDKTPSIYELPLKEELTLAEKMISKQYFGETGEFEDKVLLLVGATGAGKSTLVQAMVNYMMGVKWQDDFRFKLVIDESQKRYITAYTFYPTDGSPLPYKLTVIDTPGFGNSEGLKGDKMIAKQIK